MQNEGLADRLNNYADGLVAATFLFMGGLGAAVGEPDIRCELADSSGSILCVVVVGGAGVFYTLRWLRLWAARLRADVEVSADVILLRSRLDVARLVLVSLFLLGAVVLLMVVRGASSCAIPA